MIGGAFWGLWWVWVALGVGLGIVEILVPGFIFLGFAIGAVVLGVILAMVAIPAPWVFLLFALLSLAAVLALRRMFGHRGRDVRIIRHDINDNPPPR